MPPLEWSVVQAVVLWLVLPTFGISTILMAIFVHRTPSQTKIAIAASIALFAGMTGGLVAQTFKGGLAPFLAVEQVPEGAQPTDPHPSTIRIAGWDFEPGWRSLFAAVIVATLAEVVAELCAQRTSLKWTWGVLGLIGAVCCAILLVPWDLTTKSQWMCGLFALVSLLNWAGIRRVTQVKSGQFALLALAMIWGGNVTMVALLSHSARFGQLGILLSCGLAGIGIVSAIKGVRTVGGALVPSVFVPGLMLGIQQNAYSSIPVMSYILIATAPALFALFWLPKAREWSDTHPRSLAIAFLLPCVIATGIALWAELSSA